MKLKFMMTATIFGITFSPIPSQAKNGDVEIIQLDERCAKCMTDCAKESPLTGSWLIDCAQHCKRECQTQCK